MTEGLTLLPKQRDGRAFDCATADRQSRRAILIVVHAPLLILEVDDVVLHQRLGGARRFALEVP